MNVRNLKWDSILKTKWNCSPNNAQKKHIKMKSANYAKIRTGCVFIQESVYSSLHFFLSLSLPTLRINHNYVLSHSFNTICVYFSYNSLGCAQKFTSVRTEPWDAYTFFSCFHSLLSFIVLLWWCCTLFSSHFNCLHSTFGLAFALLRPFDVYFSVIFVNITRFVYIYTKKASFSTCFALYFFFSVVVVVLLCYYFKWEFCYV